MKDFDEYQAEEAVLYRSGERIASDISEVYSIGKDLYMLGDTKDIIFSLYKLEENKAKKIADEVYSFAPLADGSIAYIDDYDFNDKEGTLKLRKADGSIEEIDTEVESIAGEHSIETKFY